jgi:HD superfamily phosphohydrolase
MPSTYKIFRDPVHNVITFDLKRDKLLLDLVNTATFQRLRNIRQLGFSWVAYPGAEHSRFTHALGACHLAGRVLDQLGKSTPIDPADRVAAQASALLHDVGHGPFSHLYESAFPSALSHEAWGIEIVTNPASDVHQVLAAHDPALPGRVAAVLAKTYRPYFVVQLVSSQLDVDRFDYLLRDSQMTGAQYGLFDVEWIINSLVLANVEIDGVRERSLVIDAGRGLHSVEQHLLGRHFMYRQVYFHPACRAADMITKAVFKRLAAVAHPPEIPTALAAAARGDTPPLADYLELDDFLLLNLFKTWAKSAEDAVLRDLCRRLTQRKLFWALDWSGFGAADRERLFAGLRAGVARAGFDPESYALVDLAADTPYRDVMSFAMRGKPSEEIWVMTDGQLRRLSEVSDVLRSLSNRAVAQVYVCFPPEARDDVAAELHALGFPDTGMKRA